MFSQSFKPALNKDGFARLTFIGYEVKVGYRDNGTEWSMFLLNFVVKGAVRGTDKIIPITTGFSYDPDNLLGLTLGKLGFELPEVGSTLDEEGFEVADIDEDEEGFAVEEGMQLDIQGYLESIENNVYIAKISKATEGKRKGFWQIDAKTIQLFKVADKVADKPVDKEVENNSKGNGKAKNKAKPKVETVTTEETVEQLELPTN